VQAHGDLGGGDEVDADAEFAEDRRTAARGSRLVASMRVLVIVSTVIGERGSRVRRPPLLARCAPGRSS
jgi:hypothetical protein